MPGTSPRDSHRDLREIIAQLRPLTPPWPQRLRQALARQADVGVYPPRPWMREAPLLDLVIAAILAQPHRLAHWAWKRAHHRARRHGKQRRQTRLDAEKNALPVG